MHHLTQDFQLKSYLLAVRVLEPRREVSSERAGELVTVWAGQVLEEYGLNWSVVVGAVVYGGADVSLASSIRVPGVLRERCIPGTLDMAMVEAFTLGGAGAGATSSSSSSSGEGARGVDSEDRGPREVVAGVKRVMERMDELVMMDTFVQVIRWREIEQHNTTWWLYIL